MGSKVVKRAYRCIWCLQDKAERHFNVEHVMPQAFGTFEQNLTLVRVVCAECNTFFSKELEPWLARDSLEGLDRYSYGLKSTSTFKSQGKRSTARVRIAEGPYAGALGFTVAGEERLGIRPFPQIGFSDSADGPFDWYTLDQLPTREEIKAKGLVGHCHIRTCECDRAEAQLLLGTKGFTFDVSGTFEPPSGGTWVEHVFRPTIAHRRALAKIAVNYLAYEYGVEFALQTRFNEMRRLVMDGIEPDSVYYAVDERAVVHGDKQNAQRYFGHALTLQHLPDGIVIAGVVSLFNRFRHTFRLSWRPGPGIEPRGHFFDIGNRRVTLLLRNK